MKQNTTERVHRGLRAEEVLSSRAAHGENRLQAAKRKGFWRHFFENLGDPVIRILLCALGVNLLFVFQGGDVIETVGIGVSVFLATLISTLSERGSEAAFSRLSELSEASKTRVRRDGVICEIPTEEVVVGDVVLLGAGEQIPADGFVISGRLGVDQSSITGENREIEKTGGVLSDVEKLREDQRKPDAPHTVLRGSTILSGEGEMCVFAVGEESFLGGISREVQIDTRESPLKLRLSKLAKQISRLGYAAALLIALADLFNALVIDSSFHMPLILMKLGDAPYLLEKLLHAFMLGLTVIVVAVPDGCVSYDRKNAAKYSYLTKIFTCDIMNLGNKTKFGNIKNFNRRNTANEKTYEIHGAYFVYGTLHSYFFGVRRIR